MTSARTGEAAPRRAAVARRAPEWSFGDRVRKIRTDVVELRQEQFAAELGVTKAAVAAWETGRTHPRDLVAIAKRIELLSGVPAAWILGVEMGPGPHSDGDGGAVDTGTYTARCHGTSRDLAVVSPLVAASLVRYRDVSESNTSRIGDISPCSAGTTRWDEAEGSNLACAA